jgi:hypothetical protein
MSRRTGIDAPVRNLMAGIQPVQTVMDHLSYRSSHRETISMDRFAQLGIRYCNQDSSKTESGYYAKIDGQDMRLTDGAIRTAAKLIDAKPSFFNQFPDRDAFPKMVSHVVDSAGGGVLVRHDGLSINAILPPYYQVRDADELLGDFVKALDNEIGDIKGIAVDEEGNADRARYRVVMGSNLMPDLDDSRGQFMMFVLTMSETGQINAQTELGLYRTLCTNSAVREATRSRWDHIASPSKFFQSSGEVIRMTGQLQNQFSRIFGELAKQELEHEAAAILHAMKVVGAISEQHNKLAQQMILTPTDEGRMVTTHYDLFNVLTRTAQELPSMKARESAEQQSLSLFTARGGIYEELRRQGSKRRTREDLALLN